MPETAACEMTGVYSGAWYITSLGVRGAGHTAHSSEAFFKISRLCGNMVSELWKRKRDIGARPVGANTAKELQLNV